MIDPNLISVGKLYELRHKQVCDLAKCKLRLFLSGYLLAIASVAVTLVAQSIGRVNIVITPMLIVFVLSVALIIRAYFKK